MDNVLSFHPGSVPLLISMPHAGLKLTPAVRDGLVEPALGLPDTDWHMPQLYDFVRGLGASVLAGQYSRFVIDLNRPEDDAPLYAGATTGLYPATLFTGEPLFKAGQEPSAEARSTYLAHIWRPYHQALQGELARLRAEFGYALLWDAHSIRSVIPHLFDGQLPDFNLGTFNGASCDAELAEQLRSLCADAQGCTHALNGRFKGGHITRHYGDPAQHIHAVQLELSQRTYMEEVAPFTYREALAQPTQVVLRTLLEALLAWGRTRYPR
ncbi:N-formylglutamate deformylase [Pseudomonas sp. RP23018S]|uniref:N-formylglutamate deformylase n=1 Tax=Pseudomonas sp. RP23018S TaxID=3096037 RepID=UPI002ACA474D|nr:N-formylglutamate deformylase [Pseudomonas sp. RP23018S]MDZ5604146.1 N-formylglutamate deformylase [Pseudomonas sp. RP23018S]